MSIAAPKDIILQMYAAQEAQAIESRPCHHEMVYHLGDPAIVGVDKRFERLRRSRGRQLAFGIVILILSVLNLAWPLIAFTIGLLLVVLGFASGAATGTIEGIFAGSLVGIVLLLVYLLTIPLLALLALLVALRGGGIDKKLRLYGADARGTRVVGWVAFGIAMFNIVTLAFTVLRFSVDASWWF
ncbi:MAG TPA: hypothetical protein H9830_05650 [Candidatus Agrococcus pullicola]|uniref:Uncharacterized protein n=1 Tax=Candidatus Agrococcus pullicola TaxID=2838429 RepID=A0A9D1YVH2_9MICO|nr:hypothetical protein [Candidatus Agrococcus pullicola]